MSTEGQLLKNYIESKRLSKSQIASDLSMSRQNLYNLFETVKLEVDTKAKFVNYFREDIFLEKGLKPEDKKHPGPKRSQDEQNLSDLMESHKALAYAHQRLSDAHYIIAETNRTLSNVATGQNDVKSFEVLQARQSILAEYLARIASGFRYQSYADAIAALSNELIGISDHQTSPEGSVQEHNTQNISRKSS